MKFKVLGGRHHEGKKVYHKGDIIEADTDLTKRFRNKFERVYEYTPEHPDGLDSATGEKKVAKPEFKPLHKGAGKWIVVNKTANNKQVSGGYLGKEEAAKLADDLNS